MKKLKNKILPIIATILLILLTTSVYAAPISYNLKDHIEIPVKSQGRTGACWALAMSTTFETNLAVKSSINKLISARHIDYATSQSFKNNAINQMGLAKEVNTGGTPEIALAYLTNGSGPIPESEMPFSYQFGDIDIEEIQNKTREYQVKKWVQFPCIKKTADGKYINENGNLYSTEQVQLIRNSIKQHIMTNGAVYAGVNAEEGFNNYYNEETYAYCCNNYDLKSDHALVIIGWDDNYSKDNFKDGHKPRKNGAYIVQNSWGNDNRLNNGTFYISYEDAVIETGLYGIVDISKIDYDYIYQYDELGRNQYLETLGAREVYGANVFPRRTTSTEYLTQVGISTFMPVKCQVYVNPNGKELKKDQLIKVAETTLDSGYTAINLKNAVSLTSSEFAVVVKYIKTTDLLGITTIASYETDDTSNAYRNVRSALGESYFGVSLDNMFDLYTSGQENTNICIKAFTKNSINGDVNNDGRVSAVDLSILQMALVGMKKLENDTMGDVNEDGKISSVDLSKLMNILIKM